MVGAGILGGSGPLSCEQASEPRMGNVAMTKEARTAFGPYRKSRRLPSTPLKPVHFLRQRSERVGRAHRGEFGCMSRAPYLPDRSSPRTRQFVFAYTVRIGNEGREPAQLRTRHWIITDGNGNVQEVRGEGVVGKQPALAPGEGFEYTSGCVLETPHGTMHGTLPDGAARRRGVRRDDRAVSPRDAGGGELMAKGDDLKSPARRLRARRARAARARCARSWCRSRSAGKIQLDVAMLKRQRKDVLAELGAVVARLAANGTPLRGRLSRARRSPGRLEAIDERIDAEAERARRVEHGRRRRPPTPTGRTIDDDVRRRGSA